MDIIGIVNEPNSEEMAYAATNARVDNIIAHNNDTEGNSELVDIRTGVDGTVYASAGNAVRSQISGLENECFILNEEFNLIGISTNDMNVSTDAQQNGYGLLVKRISGIKRITTTIYANQASVIYCDILDANKNIIASANANNSLSRTPNPLSFTFTQNVEITTDYGYIRIYSMDGTRIAYKDYTGQTFNNDIMYGYSAGYVGEYYSDGIWSNLTVNQSYQQTLPIAVYSSTISKQSKNEPYRTILSELQQKVTQLCRGTNLYVTSAQELVDALELAQNAAADNWYNIHIASGEYDLLPFIDLDIITTVTATGYRGIEVPRYTRLIGDQTNRPHIYVYLDSDGYNCTTEQMWTVSALNLKNDAELYNLYVDCRNARYAVHDDGGNKGFIRYCENCIFEHRGYTSGMTFAYCSGYGHGTYKGSKETFRFCTFMGSKYGLYVHDNPNYNISSEISLDNCRFETAQSNSVHMESMGASASTFIHLTNNTFNAPIKKTIRNEIDSMTISGYNNSIQTTLGIEIE